MDLFQIFNRKKVFITGDTGFKGSWLSVFLLHYGAEITGYALPPLKKEDLFYKAELAKKINHIDGDVRDKNKLETAINTCQPAIIFHLAAQPLVLESYAKPQETFETNILGTIHILEIARQCSSVKAILNVTTDKCYDNKEWLYGYRENDALGGKDPYSASKACSEIVTASYRNSFFNGKNDAAIATARAGNVIGGGDWCENRIVPDCIKALQNNQIISVRNPMSIRPWQYVLEALRGYVLLGAKMLSTGNAFSGAWNFGPLQGNSKPVVDIVEKVVRYWGKGSYQIAKTEQEQHEAHFLHLDISKAIHELQWLPKLSLQDTIARTVDVYKKVSQPSANVFDIMQEEVRQYCTFVNEKCR